MSSQTPVEVVPELREHELRSHQITKGFEREIGRAHV